MPRKLWTEEEDKYLRSCVGNTCWIDAAAQLGRSVRSVYSHAFLLGLRQPKEFIASVTAAKWADGTFTKENNSCFKEGHVPANKGKRQTDYMKPAAIEATKPTRFKKGIRPANTAKVGSLAVTKDGYLKIKISEPNKWKMLHRHVWEQKKGKIPKGCNIQFKDGRRRNCNIENLYLISRSDQVAQNTIHRYPDEVKRLIRTQNKLNRLITKQNEKHTK